MYNVNEINDAVELEAIGPLWGDLLAETATATFFHSLPWLETYWRFFGHDQRLRVLVVSEDEEPFAIVPLVVRNERYRTGVVRVLTYPLDDWGSFYGPIGARPEEAIVAAVDHLNETERDWDIIDLRWAAPAGGVEFNMASATARALNASPLRYRRQTWKRTAVVDTQGKWEDYLSSRDDKFRSEIRRCTRLVSELGRVDYERYRPAGKEEGGGDPRWSVYDECVNLAITSWQGCSAEGMTLSHGHVGEFLRECHALAARLGMLDLNLLRIDGDLAAFAYNYHCQGYVYGLRVGFHPQFARKGVGQALWSRAIEDSFERNDLLFDLGPDSLAVKRNWWTRVVPIQTFTHYAMTPPAQLVRLASWWKSPRDSDDLSTPASRNDFETSLAFSRQR